MKNNTSSGFSEFEEALAVEEPLEEPATEATAVELVQDTLSRRATWGGRI